MDSSPLEPKNTNTTGETFLLRKRLEMLELIFDSIYNGVMVTDSDGYVTHFNTPYGRFLGVDPKRQIGKHCTEVIENTECILSQKQVKRK